MIIFEITACFASTTENNPILIRHTRMKKLYISDIDGTLVNNKGELSDYSKTGLNQLIKLGVLFTVASARSLQSIQQILSGVAINLPIISFNGAIISNYENGNHHTIHSIKPEMVFDIYKIIKSFKLSPFISSHDITDHLYHDTLINDGMLWYRNNRRQCNDIRLRDTFDINHILKQQIVCINIIATKNELLSLKHKISQNFSADIEIHFFENAYSPGWFWLTIQDRKATKANACLAIAHQMKIDQKNLVVFGDNSNDTNMFKIAGTSIAVSNALDNLKLIANKVIGSNTDNSVIKYILNQHPEL